MNKLKIDYRMETEMSNKPFAKLWLADQMIRKMSPNKDMTGGTENQIRITLIRGFELFNTRPYHNYENWSDGYRVEAFWKDKVIETVEREDLDDALLVMEKRLSKYKHIRNDKGGDDFIKEICDE